MSVSYNDYLELKKFSPVINPALITNAADFLLETYPHETFIELLRKTERMLSRSSDSAKKSLWVHGAFGTGKSRIVWALEQLLICSNEELANYFGEYEELQVETDLLKKLIGHKSKGKIIVASKYGADEIDNPEKLIIQVYNSLSQALDDAKIPYDNGKTMRGSVAKWLEDDANKNYFANIIQSEPYCSEGCFAGKSIENILEQLKGTSEVTSLLSGISKVARDRGINAFKLSLDDLKNWIRDIIKDNNLKAVVFIWDEFSSYFRNNKTRLESFQSLNELSFEIPFNFIIVTHFTGSIFSESDQAASTIQDRFEKQTIELPESIAFNLIGHAFAPKAAHESDWNEYKDDLNNRMEDARKWVVKYLKGVNSDDFKKIIPFHPYAALVLKKIAQLFDSNQRSMFNFIADDKPNMKAFRWFIENHSPENGDIISVDELWDYFYKTGHGEGSHDNIVGKHNLDLTVRSILDYYPTQESKLVDEEKRILKTVLMFQALSKKLNNVPEFLATEENLRRVFSGIDSMDNGHAVTLLTHMTKKKYLFMDEINRNKVYLAPLNALGRDEDEIVKLMDKLCREKSTKDLLSDGGDTLFSPEQLLDLSPALKKRFMVRKAAPDTLNTEKNQLLNNNGGSYIMRAIMLFARTSDDTLYAKDQIKKVFEDPRAANVIIIDATDTNFPDENFEKWVEYKAKSLYYSGKDQSQVNAANQEAQSYLQEWADDVRKGIFRVYTQADSAGISCPTAGDVSEYLEKEVKKRYPFTFDFTKGLAESVFKPSNKVSIQLGILGSRDKLPPRTSFVFGKAEEEELLKGVKGVDRYWEKNKDLPLSKLKRSIVHMLDKAFAPGGEGRIAISEIVDFLIGKGFMPTCLSGYLTGFLLKEYANSAYRYNDDNGAGDSMTPDKLTEIIDGYFKNLNGSSVTRYRDCYIEVLTEQQRAFAELTKKVFRLQTNASIESIALQINSKVKEFCYPLWCFEALPEVVSVIKYIEKYTLLLSSSNDKISNSGSIATEIGKLILTNPGEEQKLTELFTKENAARAMNAWLDEFQDGEFRQLCKELQVSDPLEDVRKCFGAEGCWVWDKTTGENEITKLLRDYKIISQSVKAGFITQTNSISSCFTAWKEKARSIRMPYDSLIIARKDLKPFLKLLQTIAKDGKLDSSKEREDFLTEITDHSDLIGDFFCNRTLLFKSTYKASLEGLSDNEQDMLHSSLDMSSFVQERGIYEETLNQKIEEVKKHQAFGKLREQWKEKTQSDSPADWSEKHKTPVLLLVSDDLFSAAKESFMVLNNPNSTSSEVEKAASFLSVHSEIYEPLNSEASVESSFRKKILGRYAVVLMDNNLVRDCLKKEIGSDAYNWYEHPKLKQIVERLARNHYHADSTASLLERIDKMSSERAKEYLKRLVGDNFEVGISILQE